MNQEIEIERLNATIEDQSRAIDLLHTQLDETIEKNGTLSEELEVAKKEKEISCGIIALSVAENDDLQAALTSSQEENEASRMQLTAKDIEIEDIKKSRENVIGELVRIGDELRAELVLVKKKRPEFKKTEKDLKKLWKQLRGVTGFKCNLGEGVWKGEWVFTCKKCHQEQVDDFDKGDCLIPDPWPDCDEVLAEEIRQWMESDKRYQDCYIGNMAEIFADSVLLNNPDYQFKDWMVFDATPTDKITAFLNLEI